MPQYLKSFPADGARGDKGSYKGTKVGVDLEQLAHWRMVHGMYQEGFL